MQLVMARINALTEIIEIVEVVADSPRQDSYCDAKIGIRLRAVGLLDGSSSSIP